MVGIKWSEIRTMFCLSGVTLLVILIIDKGIYFLSQMANRRCECVSVNRVEGREQGWRWRGPRGGSNILFRKRIGTSKTGASQHDH